MSTSMTGVLVLTSSTRPGAQGPAVSEWLTSTLAPLADSLGVEFRPMALSDLDLPFLDEEEHPASGIYRHGHTQRWSRLVDAADAFVVVTPEYNYGMPATLKNALDYLSREWAWKPMGFVSYGNTSAGTRSVQHAKQVITTLRLVPLGSTIALRLSDAIEQGRVREDPSLEASAGEMLAELVRLSHALRPMREAARESAGAGPIPGSYVRALAADDAAQVLVLQRCCWVEEAWANGTLDLAPLHEGPMDVRRWLAEWAAVGLWLDGRLIGMVRTRTDARVGHIGRLAVVPDLRGRGIGRWLLRHAEAIVRTGCDRLQLSTGAQSQHNIGLYTSEGFREQGASEPGTVTLSKSLRTPGGDRVPAHAGSGPATPVP